MLNDTLANALTVTLNGEKTSKKTVTIKPASSIIERVLTLLNERGYLGSFEKEKRVGGEVLILNLLGKINQCGAIKPRRNIKAEDIEKAEKRYLPARGFGVIIISTPQGIVTNDEAKKRNIGGVLLGYCY